MKKSNEPFWWSLFSAGGVLAAFLTPVLILLTGIAAQLNWLPPDTLAYSHVQPLVSSPLTKLVLLGLISLSLFHWAHRFLFTLVDLGLHSARTLIAVLCYGAAIVGSALTVIVLWRI